MMPQLPQAPQPGQVPANPGTPGGGMHSVAGMSPGALPYKQNTGAQVVDGVNRFMQAYFGTQEALKQHYSQKFQNAISMIQQGIGLDKIDYKKIAGWGRKADLPLNFEAPSEAEQQYHAARDVAEAAQQAYGNQIQGQQGQMNQAMQQPGQQPQPPAQQMAPGQQAPMPGQEMPSAALQQMLMQPTPQAPMQFNQQAPQAPPQSFMQQLGQKLGIGRPPVSMQSPAVQWMQNLAKSSELAGAMNPQNVQQQGKLQNLMQNVQAAGMGGAMNDIKYKGFLTDLATQALQGNTKAILPAILGGVIKDNVPLTEYMTLAQMMNPKATSAEIGQQAGQLMMWGKMGQPMLQHQLALEDKLLPYFGNDLTKTRSYVNDIYTKGASPLKPQYTPEQLKQMGDAMDPWMKGYPNMPGSLASLYGQMMVTGNQDIANQLAQVMSQYPRNGTTEQQQFQQRYGLDLQHIGQEFYVARGNMETERYKALEQAGGDKFRQLAEQLKNVGDNGPAKQAILTEMGNIFSQTSLPKMNYRGEEYSVGDPMQVMQGPGAGQWFMNGINPFSWHNPQMGAAGSYLSPNGQLNPNIIAPFVGLGPQERNGLYNSVKDQMDPKHFQQLRNDVEKNLKHLQSQFPQGKVVGVEQPQAAPAQQAPPQGSAVPQNAPPSMGHDEDEEE